MMARKTVTIEIDEQGRGSIDLTGFEGKSCGEVIKVFQARDLVTKSKAKREYYAEATVRRSRQQRQ